MHGTEIIMVDSNLQIRADGVRSNTEVSITFEK